ncbi:unnamed protein product [Rotaria magnacalcarata]|uniref:Uncharacterized protein n=1 Tax=Rotaria magnacalcarata TaxID=392030 RepID=A0A817A330_9BILA|nr:unnamed protein product [Rotaria magnacalcarata]
MAKAENSNNQDANNDEPVLDDIRDFVCDPLSFKDRMRCEIEYQCDDNINLVDNDNENSYQQQKSSKYKRRNKYSRNDQSLTTNSRTYTNSNSNITDNKNFQQRKSQTNDINDSNNKHYGNRENRENPFHISYQALTYAVATHLQPIKLEYVPKMNDQKEAAKFIQHFLKRCGKDRNDKEDHSLCEIKCHHCDGPHTSTDYSCSFIQQYRRELVLELRNRSDLLPAEVQLFIPTECRESGKGTKTLENR